MTTATSKDAAERARQAIEMVCTGDLGLIETYYAPEFVDHVNDMTFHGYEGGRESVGFYRAIFSGLRFDVDEQVTEGDRVASRWALHGSYRGRSVCLRGITISRFENGRIVEDWGYTDTLSLMRQLGLVRCAALAGAILTRRVKLPKGVLKPS